jgi:hypothetical protein
LAAILVVAKALLDATSEPPEITAALAATVSAIYDHLETAIYIEMDTGETTVRKMILEALDEMGLRRRLAPDSDAMEPRWRLRSQLRAA